MCMGSKIRINHYFFDESGHGGDLASARDLNFADQPVFALACVGTNDPHELAAELERLRKRHRYGVRELKSTMARLPYFVLELAEFMRARDWPIFIELVDKRFFVAIHVVNHLLCAGLGIDEVEVAERNAIAEFIAEEMPDSILLAYLAACRSETIAAVLTSVVCLREWLEKSNADVVARLIQMRALDALERVLEDDANPADFLPIADISNTGRKVWMLPNLQCLTNAYARVNLASPHGLDGVRFIHDEQLQYGKVLVDATALMEKLAAEDGLPIVPFADYRLIGRADFTFRSWQTEPCLQAADLIAGCAMRYARVAMQTPRSVEPAMQRAFNALLGFCDPQRGTGLNFVFSRKMLWRMRVSTF